MKYNLRSLLTFSIRDLFWVTIVVALGLAWSVDHWQPVTTSRIKAMLLRGGYHATDGDGDILEYMTTDGGPTISVWEFSDEQGLYWPYSSMPASQAPAQISPKR